MLSVAVAWSSSDDTAICCGLLVFAHGVIFAHNGLHGAWLRERIVKVTHRGAARGWSHDTWKCWRKKIEATFIWPVSPVYCTYVFLVCAVILVSSKCVQCRFDSLCWSNQHSVALMLLVGQQEGHPVCKNWVMRYWRGYLSGAMCRWFAYGPADATATLSSLAPVKSRIVYLSGAGLHRLSWKKAIERM